MCRDVGRALLLRASNSTSHPERHSRLCGLLERPLGLAGIAGAKCAIRIASGFAVSHAEPLTVMRLRSPETLKIAIPTIFHTFTDFVCSINVLVMSSAKPHRLQVIDRKFPTRLTIRTIPKTHGIRTIGCSEMWGLKILSHNFQLVMVTKITCYGVPVFPWSKLVNYKSEKK